MDLNELVERCREGDRDAQRALYDATVERIYRVLLRLTGSTDDAFDLTQDTYVRAFTRLGRFDGRSSFATWLYRVAVNEGLQFLRRRRKRREKLAAMSKPEAGAAEADHAATRLDVGDALSQLAETDRAMLLLRYQEGLDYRAIAEVVGCAEGTVASRLNRARLRLRELLGAAYGSAEEGSGADHLTNRAATVAARRRGIK
ncbi:MAG: RNA polymerase sigma factor [Phycisphaerae bacterium]